MAGIEGENVAKRRKSRNYWWRSMLGDSRKRFDVIGVWKQLEDRGIFESEESKTGS